jgi:hypothetical protein
MIKRALLALICIYFLAYNSYCVQYEVENANELLVGLK